MLSFTSVPSFMFNFKGIHYSVEQYEIKAYLMKNKFLLFKVSMVLGTHLSNPKHQSYFEKCHDPKMTN